MLIKVCGMRDPENIRQVAMTGIDWMGFIFYARSARSIDSRQWTVDSLTVNCQLKKMYSKDELKNLKLEFWESFASFCEVQPYLRGRKKVWTLYDTKVRGVELKFDANREGAFVILEVNTGARKPGWRCSNA